MASMILRPPILPGTMPAFTAGEIRIPFSMNRSVAGVEVQGFALKIRSAQGRVIDTIILDLRNKTEEKTKYISDGFVPFSLESFDIDLGEYTKIENLTEVQQQFINLFNSDDETKKLLISVYYKFQLAYCSANEAGELTPGYYSTVTVGKYSSEPKLTVSGLEAYPNKNDSQYTYTGVYSQANDYLKVNEEVYFEEYFANEDNYKIISTKRLTNTDIYSNKVYITLGNKRMCYWTRRIQIAGTSSDNNIIKEEKLLAQAQERDESEKLYTSKIIIVDSDNEAYYESDEQLHNTLNDSDSRTAKETFVVIKDLPKNKIYYLTYKVTTRNGLEATSERYRIVNKTKSENEFQGNITAELNSENAYIDIDLEASDEYANETGHFVISRTASNEPDVWRELYRFDLNREIPSRHIWKDFTIEQGVTYTYAIQQYSNSSDLDEPNIYTERIKSNSVMADFDYSYLFDGDRQLKIKYNPQVNSFKADLLENKTDTIGGKYPIIYRNGTVNYKEFPISGLVSYLSDDEGIFYSGLYKILEENRNQTVETKNIDEPTLSTDLTAQNFTDERNFKLAVLDWLNNGKPKLFKSASEGNYIVRTINTSLSPNDSLGRMLHTFSTQAYEVAENNYDNLVENNIINFDIIDRKQKNYSTFDLRDIIDYSNSVIIKCDFLKKIDLDEKITIIDEYSVIKRITYNDEEIIINNSGFGTLTIDRPNIGYIKFYCRTDLKVEIPHYFKVVLDGKALSLNWSIEGETGLLEEVKTWDSPMGSPERYYSVNFIYSDNSKDYTIPLGNNVTELKITDVPPETLIDINGNSYMVGPTGVYNHEGTVSDLVLKSPKQDLTGNIYLSYWDNYNSFTDLILDTQLIEYPCRQFYGKDKDIDIISDLEDVRTSLVDIYNLHFHKKNVQDIVKFLTFGSEKEREEAYLTYNYGNILKALTEQKKSFNEQLLYYSELKKDGLGYFYYYYYDLDDERYYAVARHRVYDADSCTYTYPDTYFLYYYYDPETNSIARDTDKNSSPFSFAVNSKTDIIDFDLVQTNDYYFNTDDLGVKTIKLNFGLSLEISYLARETTYKIEETNTILINSKNKYLEAVDNFKAALEAGLAADVFIPKITSSYNLYLNNLMIELKSECKNKNIELGYTQESKKLL